MQLFWDYSVYIIEILLFLTAILAVIFIVLENQNPTKTISWILAIILFPLFGLIFYFLLGRNYRKQKIFIKKSIRDFKKIQNFNSIPQVNFKDKITTTNKKIESKTGIINLLLNNNKALLSEKNNVQILNNGDETFNSIINELEKAEKHIHLDYYIFEESVIGDKIKEILIRKAAGGVKIRIILDDLGCWDLSKEYIDDFRKSGIEIHFFMPVRFTWLTTKINFRNHRKILVIDGKIGFVGGINIADRYMGGDPEIGFWRDTHLKIEGDAVKSLQIVFLTDWLFVCDQFLDSEEFFPESCIENECFVQIASSGPDSDFASIMQSYFYAIATAREYVFISTPYFIPNESILTALKTSAMSGVDIRIILPVKSDSKLTTWSSYSYIEELLDAGIKVYKYKKGFTHSKVLICDDVFCSVGTANVDIRSFDQNFEVNALIYNEKVSETLKKYYLDDLQNCDEIKLETYSKRPLINRIQESVARVFSPLL